MVKLGLLHLDLSAGPEPKNRQKLIRAIRKASAAGAEWIIMPEMAIQGYFMTRGEAPYPISVWPGEYSKPYTDLARELGKVLVISGAEHTHLADYNACAIINEQGEFIGRHRKIKTIKWITESWSTPGENLTVVEVNLFRVGVLVCADAWVTEHAIELQRRQVDMILISAAWPPGCGEFPALTWQRCSRDAGGIPVVVCNQTGKHFGMDCTIAESAIVINGEVRTRYSSSEEAILLADLYLWGNQSICTDFKVLTIEENRE